MHQKILKSCQEKPHFSEAGNLNIVANIAHLFLDNLIMFMCVCVCVCSDACGVPRFSRN